VYLGTLPPHTNNSLWRDFETLGHYAYIVSEAGGHGLQVFDLLQLDNITSPTTFSETAFYGGFGNCHTLNIDPVSQILVAMGTNTFSGGLHLVDISNPLQPTLLGGFSEAGYSHDGYILTYNGPDADHTGQVIVVACNGNSGYGLVTVNVTNPADCILLDSYGYPQTGYTHQGWFSKNGRYFLVDDELDEQQLGVPTRTHIFDLNDLDNIAYLQFYQSNIASIDHNLYVLDQFVYESNYRSGVRVLDATRVSQGILNEVGFFDLYPQNDMPQFSGTWSNYGYLPSGINLATSMYDGFFITKPTLLYLNQTNYNFCENTSDTLELKINADLQFPLTPTISGLPIEAVLTSSTVTGTGSYTFILSNMNNVAPGIYNAHLVLTTTFGEAYEIPFHVEVGSNISAVQTVANPTAAVVQETGADYIFTWDAIANATGYVFELTVDDPTFTNILYTSNTVSNQINLPANFAFETGKTYYWRVYGVNACSSSIPSSGLSFNWLPIGINELTNTTVSIYPNPADQEIFISSSDNLKKQLLILDSQGRIIMNTFSTLGSFTTRIDVSTFSSGIYVVRVGSFSQRVVVN
ncbi:MAG: choice-of-anchor B family protein, partial [Bacteroidota bacterium]